MIRVCARAALALAFLVPAECAGRPVIAFGPGEKLEYVLKWAGIAAGDSVMEVRASSAPDGRTLYHVVSTATSRSVVDVFYKVRNRYETFIDPMDGLTRKYVFHQDEGGRIKDRVQIFEPERGIVTYMVSEGGRTASQVYDIPEGTQDNLSSMYALRNEELKVGDRVAFRVFEGKKNWELIVEILAEETVQVAAGTFETFKIHPLLKYEGLFRRKGELHIWITKDPSHMPVLMKSKVSIGSIVAELASYRLASGQRSGAIGEAP